MVAEIAQTALGAANGPVGRWSYLRNCTSFTTLGRVCRSGIDHVVSHRSYKWPVGGQSNGGNRKNSPRSHKRPIG